jgi:hypothetical protein
MKRLLIILALAALPGLAAAQSTPRQGNLAVGSSEGALGMTLNVAETTRIQVNGLEDLTFDTDKGTSPNFGELYYCVFMDQPGDYFTTLTSQPFKANGKTDVPYRLRFTGLGGGVAPVLRTITFSDPQPTTAPTVLTTASEVQNCPDRSTNRIEVSFPNAPTQSGTFATTITVLVEVQ